MLKGIEFHNSNEREYQFDMTDDNNLMSVLTNNVIILCSNWRTKNFLTRQIEEILDGKHESDLQINHDYCFDKDIDNILDDVSCYIISSYRPTTILKCDNQFIVLTVEAPFIFEAHDIKDIWFADEDNNLISIYSLSVFKEHKEDWKKGKIEVYKNFINGRYGCYSGYGN